MVQGQNQNMTKVGLSPASYTASEVNETFNLKITITNVSNLYKWTADVSWNPQILTLTRNPAEGDFLKQAGQTSFWVQLKQKNTISISDSLSGSEGVTGNGSLATLTFKIKAGASYTPVSLLNVVLYSPDQLTIPAEVQAVATVSLFTGQLTANAGPPQIVNEDTPVTFNASLTTPITNDTSFHWTFEDNGSRELDGIVSTYMFDIPGVYEINLTVTNTKGEESNSSVSITVNDITPPVAVIVMEDANTREVISAGQVVNVDQLISFDGFTKSYDPENGTLQPGQYTWNFGDGTVLEHQNGIVPYSYNQTGTYNVTLTVTDVRANLNGSTTIQITVVDSNAGATQIFSLPPLTLGLMVVLTAAVILGSAYWLMNMSNKDPTTHRSEGDKEVNEQDISN